jgi:hypothetical protein
VNWSLGGLVLLALGAWSARARGELGDGDRAVALGREGLALLEAERWEDAYDRFARAEQLAHSPVFVLHQARAKRGAGELLEARRLYEQIVGSALPREAPESWVSARVSAQDELASVLARLPALVVHVTGAGPRGFGLRVDGADVKSGASTVLDPGSHEVHAFAEGFLTVRRRVELPARAVTITLNVELARAVAESRVELDGRALARRAPRSSGVSWPAVVCLGVGAAGLAVGTTTGLIALSKTQRLKDDCGGNVCSSEMKARGRVAEDFATVSTWSFAAAGVGLTAGAALLLFRADAAPLRAAARPGQLWIHGGF